MSRLRLAAALIAAGLAACGGGDSSEPAAPTFASGAACDPALSYANFGQAFLATYCTACHRPGGIIASRDWTNLDQVRAFRVQIDANAGSGPNGTFRTMPPTDPSFAVTVFPPDGERARLSGWLVCGAP